MKKKKKRNGKPTFTVRLSKAQWRAVVGHLERSGFGIPGITDMIRGQLAGPRREDRATLASMPYTAYLRTPHWKRMREEVLSRDGHRCTNCGSGDELRVHHKTYERRGHEQLGDLVTLCETCHATYHESGREGLTDHMDLIHLRDGRAKAIDRVAI